MIFLPIVLIEKPFATYIIGPIIILLLTSLTLFVLSPQTILFLTAFILLFISLIAGIIVYKMDVGTAVSSLKV